MSGIPTERFNIFDETLDKWGRLVKSWATDLDYVSQGYAAQPPRTNWVNTTWPIGSGETPGPANVPLHGQPWALPPMVEVAVPGTSGAPVALPAVSMPVSEFKAKLDAVGVTYVIPSQYTNVIVVQGDATSLVVRLPPKAILQSSEDDLIKNADGYRIRTFYASIFGTAPSPPTDKVGLMQLHAWRIGEYTMNNCD